MSLPLYLQYLGKDVKTYRDEQKPVALENIKTDLVLDAIALKEESRSAKKKSRLKWNSWLLCTALP